MRQLLLAIILCSLFVGCTAIPDVVYEPQLHNSFPQLSRVAVLPFYNQSADPTINQDQIALHYYNELQQVPGFEVMPVGVAKLEAERSGIQPHTGEDFQQLARHLGVDAVVVGSVTEYSPYYPPRLGLAVRWYAANPGFHPIPPGYGLPWGTAEEEFIPDSLVFEAEYALAKEQLQTQSPGPSPTETATSNVRHTTAQELIAPPPGDLPAQSLQPSDPSESFGSAEFEPSLQSVLHLPPE